MGSSRETAVCDPDRRGVGRAQPVRGRRLGAADRPRGEPDDHDRGGRPQDRPRHGGEAGREQTPTSTCSPLLDDLRAGRGALRPGVEPVRPRRPLRAGGACRVQGDRDLARRPRARPRDADAPRDQGSCSTPTGSSTSSSSSSGSGSCPPDDERRRAAEPTKRMLYEAAAALDAHHIKVGNIPGTPVRAAAADRGLRRALRRGGRAATGHGWSTSSCRRTSTSRTSTPRSRSSRAPGRPKAAIAIDTWHMSKLGIEPDELRRIPAQYLGWVELTDGQWENMADPVDEMINHRSFPARASSRSASTSQPCATPATTGRGASRCSPRSSATSRSTRSSTASYAAAAAQL